MYRAPEVSSGNGKELVSSLQDTRVTQRALKMSVYMMQDHMQGVDDAEWEDDGDSVFDI